MRRILIVSPHFPPVNMPDAHRVRMSLPYFREFGWEAEVLTVAPEDVEARREPDLDATVPSGVPVWRTHAINPKWTRRLGLSDVGIRAWPYLYRAGSRLLATGRFDLVYFSSTVFFTFPLGRVWKQRFRVPFVADLQDPWVTGYYEHKEKQDRPPKYWLVSRLHAALERWTLPLASGLIAVSTAYTRDVTSRYRMASGFASRTIPFGGSLRDLDTAQASAPPPRPYDRSNGEIHGVYAGVLGPTMKRSCEIICRALRLGLDCDPALFGRVRLHFLGTDYANRKRTMMPIAEAIGVDEQVEEQPERLSYFEALRTLREADFLIVPGTDDPGYTASKIYPYILARKPLIAVFREESSVVDLLRRTRAGEAVRFNSGSLATESAAALLRTWESLLRKLPYEPPLVWDEFAPFTARETTRAQCQLFDQALGAAR